MSYDYINHILNMKKPVLSYKANGYEFETTKSLIRESVKKYSNIILYEAEPICCTIEKKEENMEYKNIRFRINKYLSINCILIIHKTNKKLPLILLFSGKNSNYKEINGLQKSDSRNLNIAEQIAKEGFHILTFDYGISNEKFDYRDSLDVYHVISSLYGISPLSVILEGIFAVMNWVSKQSWFCKEKLGIFGRSLGGYIATYFSLLYDCQTAVALTNCLSSYHDLIKCNYSINGASHLYGILNEVEFDDLVLSIAPSSLHLQCSMNDPYFNFHNSLRFLKEIKNNFLNYQLSSELELKITNLGHASDIDAIVDFFNRKIK